MMRRPPMWVTLVTSSQMKKAILHLKAADPVLAAIIDRAGPYKIEYREPVFHTLVRSIVYQQLNGKAAQTIFNRLLDAAKQDPLTPESILQLAAAEDAGRGSFPAETYLYPGAGAADRAGAKWISSCAPTWKMPR